MRTSFIRIIALILCASTMFSVFVSCAKKENAAGTDSITQTEEALPEPPARDTAAILASDVYAADGLEYALYTAKTYYNKSTHVLKRRLKGDVAEIWYLAAYIEMLAEAYRLYPDNADIKAYYIDVLDKCLPDYLVKKASIKVPKKDIVRNISYYNAGRKGSGDFYYDDNAWICYQLIEAYTLLGDQKYLDLAEDNLKFLWTGWIVDGGGIYWSKDFGGPGTCSSSPTATCFLRAYQLTQKQEYLDHAIEIYDWARKKVLGNNGLYHAGVGDPWQPSYDSGTMLMNSCLLYQITGDAQYQKHAKTTATAALGHCFNITGTGAKMKAKLSTNPYYCPWAFTWMLRGITEYYKIDTKKNEKFYDCIKQLLDGRRGKLNENKQYDPYLGTGCKDWLGNGSTFGVDDVVIMPAGYSEMLLVTASFDVFYSASAEAALTAQDQT